MSRLPVSKMRRRARNANKRRRLAMPESLEPRQMLDSTPILSEIMAAGGGDFADASGQTPDWIEIYNAADHAVDLQGWFLTDRAGNLNKWEFPSGNLEPGEFLVVFASGNDEIDTDGNLHTNFELSSGGEFIALVEPDGSTIASQFVGGFPQQFNETSFGVALSSDTTPLIESGAAATVLIPTTLNGGDLLGDNWTGDVEPFDDTAWISGNTGVGFGAAPSGDPPVNLALSATAIASSEGFGAIAADGNDGNRDGAFGNGSVFHSLDPDTAAFYEVDLGQDYYLDRIQIFPRTDDSQLSVENFRIDVFNGGGTNVFSDTYQTNASTRDKPWGTADVRNILGQRVRLTRLDGTPSFLTFAEFEVYGRGAPIGANLALAGTATATNERPDALVEDAIDGDINGIFGQADTSGIGNPNNPIYHSATNEVGNFWQVDLGAVEGIDYINVYGRTDFQGNASDVTLEVLAGDGTTVVFTQNLQLVGTDLGGQRYDLTVDLTDVSGRFVKITSNQGGVNFALALAEVEVFAESGGATNPDIQTDISSEMAGVNASAFMRIPFQVADPASTDQLLLRMKYNDGFVAYINGQEVVRRNAPQTLAWDSSATAPHSAFAFEEITISNAAALLNPGAGSDNILAIQGLNTSATNPDFLMLPELFELVVETNGPPRYFPVPTPGFPSGSVAENLGPAIFSLTELTSSPDDAEDLIITARVEESSSPTATVTLFYRVQFGAEVPLAMTDDGTGADALAGDGIYTAVIPASASSPGDPVRWRVEATDSEANTSLWPMFADQLADTQSEQYFGTMIANPGVVSELPILFWWAENPAAADSRTGTRGLVSYDGEFYDNVYIRDRGGFTTPGNKFKFGDDHTFSYSDASARVSEFNVNGNGSDPAVIRQSLAFETYRAAGVPASESFLVLSQRNGVFQRVGIWIEQPDEIEFLERNNLDTDSTVYKLVSGTTNPTFAAVNGAVQKKYPEDVADKSDIQGLFDGLNLQNEQDRREFLFDTFDVPAMINFLAARAFTQDIDSTRKNFYMFRDADTDEWSFFPWDNDWTFGVVGGGSSDVANRADEIATGNANLEFASHPLIGDAAHKLYQVQYSLLHEVVQNVPETREMLLRRLRTLMDEMLQPPGTPLEDRFFENRVDELFAPVAPHVSGAVANAVEQLKAYFERRRISLYQDHNIANIGGGGGGGDGGGLLSTILPEFADGARVFVPTDNSVTDWTNIAEPANIADWSTGTTGIGYDNNADYLALINTTVRPTLGNDQFNPADDCVECTSLFVRVPFNIPDSATLDNIIANGMTLRMKYDDGFVAYINGSQVASRGVAGTQFYNSTAANRNETAAVTFEDINISASTGVLVVGDNMLAIHGINQAASSSDLLILPELSEGTVAAPVIEDAAGIPDQQLALPTIDFGQLEFNPESGNQDEEYITLVNPNDTAVDISGWSLTGGVEFTFKPGTVIPAGNTLYVSPDVNVFRARATGPSSGQGLFVQGGYAGHISNLGETINLLDGQSTQIATINTPFSPSDVQQFLRVTELHYNPAGVGDATEFIELRNTSSGDQSVTLDLAGVQITDGPGDPFEFAQSNVTSLAPGEYVLVVKDQAAFTAAYGDVDGALIAGEFAGSLSNGGETIKIEDADNSTVVEFKYENGNDPISEADWPAETDGNGFSLVVIDVAADYDSGTNWRSSAMTGGSPGGADPQPLLGNFNGDTSVNRPDAVRLLANLGRIGNSHRARGDANGDRATTLIDLALLQSGFGATHIVPSPAQSAAPLSAVEAVDAHFSRAAGQSSRTTRTIRVSSRGRLSNRDRQPVTDSGPSSDAVSQRSTRSLRARRMSMRHLRDGESQ